MPLIRKGGGSTPSSPESETSMSDLAALLQAVNADHRWRAARDLGAFSDAWPELAAALLREERADIREVLFTSLVQIGSLDSARAAARFIRSDDAAMRTCALDALSAMPATLGALLPELLCDPDRDVRLLSCELARSVAPGMASRELGRVLRTDPDLNVCGAAVEVLAEAGDANAIASLKACKARFPGEAFLGFAVDEAIARLGDGHLAAHE
jgi:hypothetical protein